MEQTTPLNGTTIRDQVWKKKKKGVGPWILFTILLLGLATFYAGQRSGSTSLTRPGGTTRGGTIATASLTMSSNEAVNESSYPCLHVAKSCQHDWECCSRICSLRSCTRGIDDDDDDDAWFSCLMLWDDKIMILPVEIWSLVFKLSRRKIESILEQNNRVHTPSKCTSMKRSYYSSVSNYRIYEEGIESIFDLFEYKYNLVENYDLTQ